MNTLYLFDIYRTNIVQHAPFCLIVIKDHANRTFFTVATFLISQFAYFVCTLSSEKYGILRCNGAENCAS